jgi:hypothetical protein
MTAAPARWRARPRAAESGFLLPLSIAASLLLLLSSLSLQLAVLHSQRLQVAAGESQRAEDAVVSVAHRLAVALHGPYSCLRALPSSAWRLGALPLACPAGLDPTPLLQSSQAGQTVRLSDWQPNTDGGQLVLQVADGGYQRRFVLTFTPVVGLREVG